MVVLRGSVYIHYFVTDFTNDPWEWSTSLQKCILKITLAFIVRCLVNLLLMTICRCRMTSLSQNTLCYVKVSKSLYWLHNVTWDHWKPNCRYLAQMMLLNCNPVIIGGIWLYCHRQQKHSHEMELKWTIFHSWMMVRSCSEKVEKKNTFLQNTAEL